MDFGGLLDALSWRDVVDLLAVFFLAYNVLLLIRGTRAVQVLLGILVLLAIAYVARQLELRTLEVLLNGFLILLPFGVIVLFQSQLRRALANFGKNPLYGLAHRNDDESNYQEIVLAATTLSKRRIGALIVVERLEGLRDYVENGIAIDGKISFDLLTTIFTPGTPLHDGAVIIQGQRIAAAACFLPLSSSADLPPRSGTRHRAAIGITEETDAVAVVVSEETGRISVATRGVLTMGLDGRALRNSLYRHFVSDQHTKSGASAA